MINPSTAYTSTRYRRGNLNAYFVCRITCGAPTPMLRFQKAHNFSVLEALALLLLLLLLLAFALTSLEAQDD